MGKKLFITDIDGTLLHDSVGLSDVTVRVANEFIRQGHYLALCTGRSLHSVRDYASRISINAPSPLLTGSIIYDFNGGCITHRFPLDNSILELIQVIMEDLSDIAVQVFSSTQIYTIKTNDFFNKKGVKSERRKIISSLYEAASSDVYKILLVHENSKILKECKKKINGFKSITGGELVFKSEFASRHFLEIVSLKAGKDRAVEIIQSDLRVNIDNTYIAGDGLTDLSMFRHARVSFAPEDAIDKVRQSATRIFTSAKKHGIIDVFRFIMEQ